MVSLKSKHGALKIFYTILSNFKNHKPITNETKHRKNRSLNNVNQFYNTYFDTCKKSYDSENLNERDGKFSHPNQFKILGKKKQEPEWTEEKTKREMQKIVTAQKMKFSIKDFFCKCDEICSFQWNWSHLLKKSLMENLIFCAVNMV